jgi:hypothetical protein
MKTGIYKCFVPNEKDQLKQDSKHLKMGYDNIVTNEVREEV